MKKIFEVSDDEDIVFLGKRKPSQTPRQAQSSNGNGAPSDKRPSSSKKGTGKLKFQRFVASFLIFCVTLGVIGTAGVWVFAMDAWKDNPDMYLEDFQSLANSQLKTDKDITFHTAGLKSADSITYDELPQVLVDAFIATEDSRFFVHNGVDVPRFTKAMMINVKDSLSRLRLSFSQGGSTITMQLIKNTYFVKEDVQGGDSEMAASSGVEGVQRKFQELYLATKLERDKILTKQQEIAFYLNNIYFGAGNNTMGIKSSAERYFEKDVSELNLVESAFMAGVINAPNAYSPYQSIRKAKERTHSILDLMLRHGYITEEERDVAKAVPIENLFVNREAKVSQGLEYQAYIDLVHDEVKDLTGLDFISTPMIIYTNMNESVQKGIDKVQNREVAHLNPGDSTKMQMGSSIVENKTGAVVGVFGGYDYNNALAFNRAKDSKAQPGSVIKAVLSYPLAFEHLGISTKHIMEDAPYVYAGMSPDKGLVKNHDNKYLGDIELDYNFAGSRNTTALRLLDQVAAKISNQGVLDYLNSLGFTNKDFNELTKYNVAYAIGGGELVASPLELSGALATIMNDGKYIKPTTIRKIEFLDGRDPIINEPKETQVIDPASAFLTTELMKHAVSGPNAGYMKVTRRSYPVYGKTGTNGWSREHAEKFGIPFGTAKNRNMFTSTDRFSISTWVGFDYEEAEYKPWFDGALTKKNFQGNFNAYALDLLAKEFGGGHSVAQPDDVASITHIKGPFPYQRPIDGMNPDMVVDALINKRHLSLVDPQPQTLDNLADVQIESSQMGNQVSANVSFSPYPDESKLTVAPNTKEMTVPGLSTVYTGRRLYDDSWLYGAVQYSVDVLVDGEVVNTLDSAHSVVGVQVNVPAGSKLELCAYYSYSNSSTIFSNRICNPVEVDTQTPIEELITLPSTNSDVASFKTLANAKGIKYSYVSEPNTDKNTFGKVAYVRDAQGNDIGNQSLSLDDINNKKIVVGIYDYTYTVVPNETTIGAFYDLYKGKINMEVPAEASRVNPLTGFNNENAQSIKLLDYYTNKTLILK